MLIDVEGEHHFTLDEFACLKPEAAIYKLKMWRRAHYRLWKCSNAINRCFGWNILVLILYYFYFVANTLVRVFLYVDMKLTISPLGFLRNLYRFI